MNKPKLIVLYKPSVTCSKCGGNYVQKYGIRGVFFGCSGFPLCTRSTDAISVEFTIFSFYNIQIKNNSQINCIANNKKYINQEILLHEGCFGINTKDGFILLKDCDQITLSKILE